MPKSKQRHIINQAGKLPVTMKGLNFMGRFILAFPSVTVAMKAQTLLRREGFGCNVIRTPRNLASGCGYSVVLDGSIQLAAAVLEKWGIPPKAIGRV